MSALGNILCLQEGVLAAAVWGTELKGSGGSARSKDGVRGDKGGEDDRDGKEGELHDRMIGDRRDTSQEVR